MASPLHITPSQLARLIGTHSAPVIIDVRIPEDFNEDPRIIPAAIRHPFNDIESLAESLSNQRVVVYCQKGLKISEGAAAILRTCGIQAEVLQGGQFGWRDENLPMVNWHAVPRQTELAGSVWVTRTRPKVDRIACPWLIKRFVDPNAQFLFVSASQVQGVADRFNATPFDIDDVFWSHRNAGCTFDTMLEEFGLNSAALNQLAKIVRAADTGQPDTVPQAHGLLAASLGLSRMYSDDLAQLDAGIPLYDMLYRWCRDATNEAHSSLSAENTKKST